MLTTRATYADLARLPHNQVGELIDGTLYAWPRPRPSHARVAGRLLARLDPLDSDAPNGWHVLIEPEVELAGQQVVVPDLAGWRRADVPALPDDVPLRVVPAWMCEIASPSTARHDRVVKLPLYARAGIQWLWNIDPGTRLVDVYSRDQTSRWVLVGSYSAEREAVLPPFDSLTLDVAALWR